LPYAEPRILLLDIETKPAEGYFWGLFDQTIGIAQLKHPGGMLCCGMMWKGQRKVHMFSEWEHGRIGMAQRCHAMMSEADMIVGYNSDRFDLPKLMGEFLLAGLPKPPPAASMDVYKHVKKLGFISNKLAFIGPLLTHDEKIKHEGFSMWIDVLAGCPKAQRKMARYCAQDVRLLEKVYDKILPYISNHPHLGYTHPNACGACGSGNTQHRGYHRSKSFRTERIHCQDCGSWQQGKRQKAA
jgi:hypothetical protein